MQIDALYYRSTSNGAEGGTSPIQVRVQPAAKPGELRVGLLVLIAIAVLIVLILNASGNLNPFARHLHLRARFTDANGLREGSEVRLAGVRIGKVDRIRLMTASEVGPGPNPSKIEVFMTINNVNTSAIAGSTPCPTKA